MISSKLKKGKTSELLVEFSKNPEEWPSTIKKFHEACKDENVKINKTHTLKPGMVRFYIMDESSKQNEIQEVEEYEMIEGRVLKSKVSKIELKLTLIYLNDEQEQIPSFNNFVNPENMSSRVLLLRETLSSFYDLHYEIESTLSPQESISYLCELSATLINCKYEGEIEQYQQKKELMIKKGSEGSLKSFQAAWRNMMFQVPGIGKDKAKNITQAFPSYEAVIGDFNNKKSLKDLIVGRGVKGAKIGKAAADRIYKVFGSENNNEKLY